MPWKPLTNSHFKRLCGNETHQTHQPKCTNQFPALRNDAHFKQMHRHPISVQHRSSWRCLHSIICLPCVCHLPSKSSSSETQTPGHIIASRCIWHHQHQQSSPRHPTRLRSNWFDSKSSGRCQTGTTRVGIVKIFILFSNVHLDCWWRSFDVASTRRLRRCLLPDYVI